MSNRPSSPLIGDGHGRYRVHIVGNSGSGKSTAGQALARMLGVPYISLDKIMWQPGWIETPAEEFKARLRAELDQAPDKGWVVDGNYERRGGSMALEESTDIIWLDPPLLLYFPRIIWRTFLRLFRLREPCSPGCNERPTEVFFSKESIIWWCLSQHWIVRHRNEERMRELGLHDGTTTSRRRMRRLGGWGAGLKKWLQEVEEMVRSKKD
ncbi:hypothetical protein CVT25_003864 [Psilocybe cyanescens]|uniref:Adenylate kinase n=1 Tax=Psilocybe cyanescens TaxID=93625 RepID=A0A409XPM4_PSICY|nr:hypothetical protein CVT25_003864 [Psilocybe cyanescens]